jgi:hypothetical protein
MKRQTLICMLAIACLCFAAADCSKCKKGDPGYPNCGDTTVTPPPPPPPPQPTVERWSCLAWGHNTEANPDIGLFFYPYGYRVLELWNDGRWNLEHPNDNEYHRGIYRMNIYVTLRDTFRSLDLYNVYSNDTILWKGFEVKYTNRHNANHPFPIPSYVIQTMDSLQLNPVIMHFYQLEPPTYVQGYEYYVKMQ